MTDGLGWTSGSMPAEYDALRGYDDPPGTCPVRCYMHEGADLHAIILNAVERIGEEQSLMFLGPVEWV